MDVVHAIDVLRDEYGGRLDRRGFDEAAERYDAVARTNVNVVFRRDVGRE
jgi:hypothetical protein